MRCLPPTPEVAEIMRRPFLAALPRLLPISLWSTLKTMPVACSHNISAFLQIVQRTLLAAVSAQLIWHFAIQPWWNKRRGNA